jgi:hypothetical protein
MASPSSTAAKSPFVTPATCRDFLRDIASGAGLNLTEIDSVQVMHGTGNAVTEQGALDLLQAYACQSKERADEVIDNVADIISRLLDRILDIPGLIHSNNMLYYRVRLMERAMTQANEVAKRLKEEQVTLLKLLAHMAQQVHRIVASMGLKYEATNGSGQLYAQPGNTVFQVANPPRAFFNLTQTRLAHLFDVLSSAATGTILGQPLTVHSYPRVSLTFQNATFSEPLAQKLRIEVANAIYAIVRELGGQSPAPNTLEPYIYVLKGSVQIVIQFTSDADAIFKAIGSTDESKGRMLLQRALLQLAFAQPGDTVNTAEFAKLYNNESTKLPTLQIPNAVTNDDPNTNEIATLLKDNFSYNLPDLTVPGVVAPSPAISPATVPKLVITLPAIDATDANKEQTVWTAVHNGMPDVVKTSLTVDEFKTAATSTTPYYDGQYAMAAAGTAMAAHADANSDTALMDGAPTAIEPGFYPTESLYSGQFPFGAHRRHTNHNAAVTHREVVARKRAEEAAAARAAYRRYLRYMATPYTGQQMALAINLEAVLSAVNKKGTLQPNALAELAQKLNNRPTLFEALQKHLKPLDQTMKIEGVDSPTLAESDREVVAGVDSVKLEAQTVAKSEMLAKIKQMAESSDVKEFVRVRPYNDKDLRATELQLGTIDQEYDRSPDPAVVQGQLGTKVRYAGECLDFTNVFQSAPNDQYFKTFEKFIINKPPRERWFSTVNGGVFFEPQTYMDTKRLTDGRGLNIVSTDMLSVRKQVAANVDYHWVDDKGSPTTTDDPDKARIVPKTPKETTLNQLRPQLQSVAEFKTIYQSWVTELTERQKAVKEVISQTSDATKKASLQRILGEIPQATENNFLDEYYRTRVLSEAINREFVDTTWPVLRIFFGTPVGDGTINTKDTKNVVAFFYGASGSGKTFTAEAILDKVFEAVLAHKDEFKLKLLVDYNNDLYDYYSPLANAELLNINEILQKTDYAKENIGKRLMRKKRFEEMALRAKFLGWKSGDARGVPADTFYEGNPKDNVKLKVDDTKLLENLRTYSTGWQGLKPENVFNGKAINRQFDSLKAKPPSGLIPKNPKDFATFKADLIRRVENFRSVTDTGLNPESSRSHLLYIIQRVTKDNQPMSPSDRGAQFIMADFAGTENLNYLMTPTAWKVWKKWKNSTENGGVGSCTVAGRQVTNDWACLNIPALAKGSIGNKGITTELKNEFNNALAEGWINIKVKTLVSKEISENPAPPKDLQPYRDALVSKWRENMDRPYVTTGEFAKKYMQLFFKDADIDDGGKALADLYSAGLSKDQADATKLNVKETIKALKDEGKNTANVFSAKGLMGKAIIETNPNRLAITDNDNRDIIVNMVLAMHAESRHINDSLHEITRLVQAQRQAINTHGPQAKANIDDLKLTKRMVKDVLANAITAGSSVITIGAMNPRRTNDFDTYNTMVNITEMNGACVTKK